MSEVCSCCEPESDREHHRPPVPCTKTAPLIEEALKDAPVETFVLVDFVNGAGGTVGRHQVSGLVALQPVAFWGLEWSE